MTDDYVTFDVFAKMLIENIDESKQNIHWQSQYYICNICQIKYDYIVRSEDSDDVKNRIVEMLKLPLLPSKEAYYEKNSASTKNHKNLALSDQKVDSYTIKELYRRFYFDFLVLGYSPNEVTRLL